MLMQTTAAGLQPGDVLSASKARVHRVVPAGLFERNSDDTRSQRPWPKGKVEVLVSYPDSGPRVVYWNRRTLMCVQRGEA